MLFNNFVLGEVSVSQEQLDSLLKSAESLQIRGLSGSLKWGSEEETEVKKRKISEEPAENLKNVKISSLDEPRENSSRLPRPAPRTESPQVHPFYSLV